ncbi:YbhB/YbcL family Raf kinase inhibitor-like protein [bacterium]|nr:YbhB/YbcL family Raf kinase inhibitor-like protein [bacterium]
MVIASTAFSEGDLIPPKYTCDGSNFSPPLIWEGAPPTTESFALICDDPDAPRGTWVHWVLFNLPANIHALPEHIPTQEIIAGGARQGINDSHTVGYDGPCPPGGTHRYYFKLYALDRMLDHEPGMTKADLLNAMQSHILAEAQVMGRYKRT